MADNIDELDKLFKNALSNHSSNPDPEVWDKLSATLDNNNKGTLFIPLRWVAGVAVVLVAFGLFHLSFDVAVQDTSLAVQDTQLLEINPFSIPPTSPFIGKEKTKSPTKNSPKELIGESRELTPKEKPDKHQPQVNWSDKERVIEQLPQALAQIEPINNDELMVNLSKPITLSPSIKGDETTEKPNKDYKVRIISNGFAIQPEKEQFVDELENKIGGFFTKVDEGFGGLRDAKNNLFASLTTKRDKKKN